MNWIQIFKKLKNKSIEIEDWDSAEQFREIERWLSYNHPIEEVFYNRTAYNEIVKIELLKLERRKKIYKINKSD